MLFEKQGGEKLTSSVSWYSIHLLQEGGLKHWQQKKWSFLAYQQV